MKTLFPVAVAQNRENFATKKNFFVCLFTFSNVFCHGARMIYGMSSKGRTKDKHNKINNAIGIKKIPNKLTELLKISEFIEEILGKFPIRRKKILLFNQRLECENYALDKSQKSKISTGAISRNVFDDQSFG